MKLRHFFLTFKIAQVAQVTTLLLYVIIGPLLLNWPKPHWHFLTLLIYTHLLDYLIRYKMKFSEPFKVSPTLIIISSAIFLLVHPYKIFGFIFAATAAVLSRFIFKINNRPIFNPANFGVIAATFIFPYLAGSLADQWDGHLYLIATMIVFGMTTTVLSKQYWITASYVVSFALLSLLRSWVFSDSSALLTIASVLGPASLLFCFHMITDPQTTPKTIFNKILFGSSVAIFDIILRTYKIVFAQFIALSAVCVTLALLQSIRAKKIQQIATSVFALLIFSTFLLTGFANQSIPLKDPYNIFQEFKNKNTAPLDFAFSDQTDLLNLNFQHGLFEYKSKYKDSLKYYNLNSAAVAVSDINGDGFYDIFLTTLEKNHPNTLFINNQGNGFKDQTEQWGLGSEKNYPWPATGAVFVDINNDRLPDLFLIRMGCVSFYLNAGKKFIDQTKEFGLENICGHFMSINYFDYNQDGFTDIILGSFFNSLQLKNKQPAEEVSLRLDQSTNNRRGGENILLKNMNGKFFKDVSNETNANDSGMNWAIGIGDFNNDGWPDFYLANDYGPDNLYLNEQGHFVDKSKDNLGKLNSRASMAAEIADFNNDGLQDIYVTNKVRVGSIIGKNYLWSANSKQGEFLNAARNLDMDKCGVSWGAKFIDVNHDGWLDLFVSNGMFSDEHKGLYWYSLMTYQNLPGFLRTYALLPSIIGSLGSNVASCLFLSSNQGNKFDDVGLESGFTDLLNGRGVALIDYDNDGSLDVVINNHNSKALIYKGIQKNKNNWIGFQLFSQDHRPLWGAKVQLSCNQLVQTKEIYPANGFNSQSDDRIVFGLGSCTDVNLSVLNLKVKETKLKMNSYNRIEVLSN